MTVHPIDTEALRRLADAATPGPWENTRNGVQQSLDAATKVGDYKYESVGIVPKEYVWQDDAEFIAAARTAVPALLDALAAAEAEARRLSAKCGILKANHADDMEALRRESDEDTAFVLDRAVRAESRVKAVRNLHKSDGHGAGCGERDCYPSCLECDEDFPCATILALDSKLEGQ